VIELELWSHDDLPLLKRFLGDAAMMTHLGGPQTEEQIQEAHRRHAAVAEEGKGGLFKVLVDGVPVGGAGYWQKEWRGEQVWEAGWHVHPEHQGKGLATQAVAAVIARAREDGRHRFLHAFPDVGNAASNAVCRKLGFTLQGACDFEYPKGRPIRCNDWRLDLQAPEPPARG
jgi:RimJ/RimL family protein N-acetyltransferase